jgi:hypothetical protein
MSCGKYPLEKAATERLGVFTGIRALEYPMVEMPNISSPTGDLRKIAVFVPFMVIICSYLQHDRVRQ